MKTISFVIPVYNEEARINKTFEALQGVAVPRGLRLENIIFVDDGSTDATFELLCRFSKQTKMPVTVISYKQNSGKGHGVRLGMLESKSDYALFFDADMSTPLSELTKFLPLIKRGTSVVVGTRKNGHSTVVEHQPLYRELMGKVFTKITQVILSTDITDFTCGFKAFSRTAVKTIFSKAKINGWGYDAEILFLAKKHNFSLKEVAVTWANDARTKVDLKSAIIKTLFELATIRWTHSIKPAFKILTESAGWRTQVTLKFPVAKLKINPFRI